MKKVSLFLFVKRRNEYKKDFKSFLKRLHRNDNCTCCYTPNGYELEYACPNLKKIYFLSITKRKMDNKFRNCLSDHIYKRYTHQRCMCCVFWVKHALQLLIGISSLLRFECCVDNHVIC